MAKREAPGELERVRAFVNTLDRESGADSLAAWVAAAGVPATPGALARACAVREALRALLLANNGEPPDPEAPAVLDAAARRAGLSVRFSAAGASLEPRAGGLDAALGALLGIAARAMQDGSFARLKACRASGCAWAFYDHTKNRSGRWCSMEVCGNRTKVRTYRARANAAGAGDASARSSRSR